MGAGAVVVFGNEILAAQPWATPPKRLGLFFAGVRSHSGIRKAAKTSPVASTRLR